MYEVLTITSTGLENPTKKHFGIWAAIFPNHSVQQIYAVIKEGMPPSCAMETITISREAFEFELVIDFYEGRELHSNYKVSFYPKKTSVLEKADVFSEKRKGYGRQMLGNIAQILQIIDSPRLFVRATGIGSYLYLKMGFQPLDTYFGFISAIIVNRLNKLKEYNPGKLDEINAARQILFSDDPKSLMAIANIDVPVKINDQGHTLKIGQAVTIGVDYKAIIDFKNDIQGAKAFYAYSSNGPRKEFIKS